MDGGQQGVMEPSEVQRGPGKRREGRSTDERRERRLCRQNFLEEVGAVRSRNDRARSDIDAIRRSIDRSGRRRASDCPPDGPERGRAIGGSLGGAGRRKHFPRWG